MTVHYQKVYHYFYIVVRAHRCMFELCTAESGGSGQTPGSCVGMRTPMHALSTSIDCSVMRDYV